MNDRSPTAHLRALHPYGAVPELADALQNAAPGMSHTDAVTIAEQDKKGTEQGKYISQSKSENKIDWQYGDKL